MATTTSTTTSTSNTWTSSATTSTTPITSISDSTSDQIFSFQNIVNVMLIFLLLIIICLCIVLIYYIRAKVIATRQTLGQLKQQISNVLPTKTETATKSQISQVSFETDTQNTLNKPQLMIIPPPITIANMHRNNPIRFSTPINAHTLPQNVTTNTNTITPIQTPTVTITTHTNTDKNKIQIEGHNNYASPSCESMYNAMDSGMRTRPDGNGTTLASDEHILNTNTEMQMVYESDETCMTQLEDVCEPEIEPEIGKNMSLEVHIHSDSNKFRCNGNETDAIQNDFPILMPQYLANKKNNTNYREFFDKE